MSVLTTILPKLSRDELIALHDALAQYVENNDPEEIGEDAAPKYAAGVDLMKAVDAYRASAAE